MSEPTQSAAPARSAGATIARNSAWLVAGNLAGKAMTVVFMAVAANRLRTEGYGLFQIVLAFGSFFHVLVDFGFSTLMIERGSKDREALRHHLRGNLGLKLALYPLGLVAYAACLPLFGYLGEEVIVYFLGYAMVVANSQAYLLRGVLAAVEDLKPSARADLTERFAAIGLGALALWVTPLALPFLAALVLGAFARVLVLWSAVRARGFAEPWRFSLPFVREHVRDALPHALHSIAGMLQQRVDMVMLGALRPAREAGLYGAAFDKVFGLVTIGGLVAGAYAPTASRAWKEDREEYLRLFRRAFALLPVLGLPASAGIALCAPGITALMHTDEYAPSAAALAWLAPYVALRFWILLHASALLAAGRIGGHLAAELTGLAVKVALNAWLLPAHGFVGVAAANAVSEAVVLAVDSVMLRRVAGTPLLPLHWAWRPIAATAAMAAGVWLLREAHVLAQVAAGAVLYGAAFLALGGHRQDPAIARLLRLR